jgi:hypothetical protein
MRMHMRIVCMHMRMRTHHQVGAVRAQGRAPAAGRMGAAAAAGAAHVGRQGTEDSVQVGDSCLFSGPRLC